MLLVILSLLFVFNHGSHLPPGVTLCHRSDPNFNQCVGKHVGEGLQLFANGSKYYGMPQLEPFFIKEMVLKGEATQSVAIEQIYSNLHIFGMVYSDTSEGFKIDLDEKCGWTMNVKTPVMTLEGDYQLKGQILMFPLNGHGKCKIIMYNTSNIHTATCETYTREGKTYLKLTKYTMNMRVENIAFNFENVFPENEQIAAEINKTLNENSLAIFNDVKDGYEEVFSAIHLTMMNKFFDKEPINEVFLD